MTGNLAGIWCSHQILPYLCHHLLLLLLGVFHVENAVCDWQRQFRNIVLGLHQHCHEERCVLMKAVWEMLKAQAAVLHQLHK
jgi:hypothetical protein